MAYTTCKHRPRDEEPGVNCSDGCSASPVIMYPLFEIVRLLSVHDGTDTRQSNKTEIRQFAWAEVGELSQLAAYCSNEYLLLRCEFSGKPPIVRQIPWLLNPIACMCYDPTASWLLVSDTDEGLFIVPALKMLDPSAGVDQLWRIDDVTSVKTPKGKGTPSATCWWHTLDGDHIAIVGTMNGDLMFVDLLKQEVVAETLVYDHIVKLNLVRDDQQTSTHLLITSKGGIQWDLLLESRTQDEVRTLDSPLTNMGYGFITSITAQTDENKESFVPTKFPQFQRSMYLCPQYAKGRHFITAHCDKTSTYQIYDSHIEHSPLFVYKVPVGAYNLLLADKVIFTTTRINGKKLVVISNQKAETSIDDQQDFNKEAVLQQFDLPQNESLLLVFKKAFPFYWHHKLEEDLRSKGVDQSSGSLTAAYAIQLTTHTVLDGCMMVTDSAVYECRPKWSPERLFLELSIQESDASYAENLGISLGLDINTLFELAAEYLLSQGDYKQAVRLYQLSKCSHVKRVASFARYGRIQEVMTYLRQVNRGSLDMSMQDRKQLSDMALHCYTYQLVNDGSADKGKLVQGFREFLLNSFSYDEKMALQVLAQHGLADLLFDMAKARGLMVEALERYQKQGHCSLDLPILKNLVQKGFSTHLSRAGGGIFLRSLEPEDLVNVLTLQPQLALHLLDRISDVLPSLTIPSLLTLAEMFDPSKSFIRGQIAKQQRARRRTGSQTSLYSIQSEGSENSIESSLPDAAMLVEFFITIVLVLNERRELEDIIVVNQSELLNFDLPKDVLVKSVDSIDQPKRHLACRPIPIGCGSSHSALVRNGSLYTWGRTQNGRLGHGNIAPDAAISPPFRVETLHMLQIKVISVACGGEHTIALTQQGVYSWGSSRYGQVGIGPQHTFTRPMLIEGLSNVQCVAVDSGQYHSMALTADGEVYCWGWGVHGQLGNGFIEDGLVPIKVQGLSNIQVVKISAGYCHSVILTVDGDVWTFGCGLFGQLGLGSNVKFSIPEKNTQLKEKCTLIATKYFHTAVVTVSNKVYTWGSHPHTLKYSAHLRRTKDGVRATTTDPLFAFLSPLLIDTSMVTDKIIQVSCGSFHTGVMTTAGNIFMWGRNLDGQLGIRNRQDSKIPTMIGTFEDKNVSYFHCGGEYNIAVDTDNTVWCWGKNDGGQLGIVNKEPIVHPRQPSPGIRPSSGSITMAMMDVIKPEPLQGLPGVMHSPLEQSFSDSLNSIDNGSGNSEDCYEEEEVVVVIPKLAQIGKLRYNPSVIWVVLKHMPHFCHYSRLVRLCIDHSDWLSVARVNIFMENYAQACAFHIKSLTKYKEQIDNLEELSKKIMEYYTRAIKDQNLQAHQKEDAIKQLLIVIFQHWERHALSIVGLEEFFMNHDDTLGCTLGAFLFSNLMSNSPSDSADPVFGLSSSLQSQFSPNFCVYILQIVLSKIQTDIDKSNPISYESFKEIAGEELLASNINLLPASKLRSYDGIWQEIQQNLKKSTEKNFVSITESNVQYLQFLIQNQESSASDTPSASGEGSQCANDAIVFTCGHYYSKKTFHEDILTKFNNELTALQSSLRLPQSAALFSRYYRMDGFMPLACPKCVLNALPTIQQNM